MDGEKPLAAAARRLRGKPGRPRTRPRPEPVALVDPLLLGVPQVAALLSVSEDIVRNLITAGKLPIVRLPGGRRGRDLRRVLIARDAVVDLIRKNQATSP